jgi:hypothetical protein
VCCSLFPSLRVVGRQRAGEHCCWSLCAMVGVVCGRDSPAGHPSRDLGSRSGIERLLGKCCGIVTSGAHLRGSSYGPSIARSHIGQPPSAALRDQENLGGVCFLYSPWLRSGCRVSLQPANAAPASMDLVLATAAQCGDSRPGRQGNVDGRAQCDRVHAGGITGACVVPREKLRRAKQATSCPMSCLLQARALQRRT